jgi:outer membrane protein insertion porin family
VVTTKTFIISAAERQTEAADTTPGPLCSIESSNNPGTHLLRRNTSLLVAIIGLLGALLSPAAHAGSAAALSADSSQETPAIEPASALAAMADYVGKTVLTIELPGVRDASRLLPMLPQKVGQPLDRDQVRDSVRVLFATGRFADIQAEVTTSGSGVILGFTSSPNYFVGAVAMEGAPGHPNTNQVVNATKLQLGELYTTDKLNRALQNIRQLMQENGYYRARVTSDSTLRPDTHQIDITFRVAAGQAAHVGYVNVTGHSSFSQAQVENIAHMHPGDRVTASRVTNSLQRLRKKLQKEHRVIGQVSIAAQNYLPASNSVDYTYLIDPGPVVILYTLGFHISSGVLKKEIPVYQENAVDDDLLNEGKNNLLNYLQTRGRLDASVQIEKQSAPDILRVVYRIDPGPLHKFVLLDITGNKYFSRKTLRQRMQIQPARTFLSDGRFSSVLLKSDAASLQALYVSNGFRQAKIVSHVDDNYEDIPNHLAVHIRIEEGPQTLVGTFHITGNQKLEVKSFPELSTREGQPYSEQSLASDREAILNYYFNHGFPNATLDILTKPATQPNREDVTYEIHEGEQFFVNQVLLAGLDHTRRYVVQREIQVVPGQPLSQQEILATQSKLYDLGIFNEVDTGVQNPEGTDPEKNVLVQVQEAKRYTFTYGGGLEFETGLPARAPAAATGVSPRVEFDITRLNVGGRDQSLTFQSAVGSLQQRGLISYQMPRLFNSNRFKVFYTIFYDYSLDVATFTSQRLEGKIDIRQELDPQPTNHPTSITYHFDYRRVKATDFVSNFSPAEFSLLSLPAVVGGPGFTFIRDKRDNPLQSTRGQFFSLDTFLASGIFGSEANYGRALARDSTYNSFGSSAHKFVFAHSTSLGLEQVYRGTRVLPPGACEVTFLVTSCSKGTTVIPLPELFFAGGDNSHRGFALNQAGPRDPDSGFPVGGSALFIDNEELRFPSVSLPYLGEGFGFAIFHDMGNVFTAGHDMVKGVLRWHQGDPAQCLLPGGAPIESCMTYFNNYGYDYTSHAAGLGLLYKTPIGPFRFDFGYNLNPPAYFQGLVSKTGALTGNFETQRLHHFNVYFSIGQPF